jgi:hypothetical protein
VHDMVTRGNAMSHCLQAADCHARLYAEMTQPLATVLLAEMTNRAFFTNVNLILLLIDDRRIQVECLYMDAPGLPSSQFMIARR